MSVRKHPPITMKQIGGDDGYHWCVLVDGEIKWDGMNKSEAKWRLNKELAAYGSQPDHGQH